MDISVRRERERRMRNVKWIFLIPGLLLAACQPIMTVEEPSPTKAESTHPPAQQTAVQPLPTSQEPAETEEQFAIYLLEEGFRSSELPGADLSALPLQGKPFLTTGDILAYVWQRHEMELSAEAFARVSSLFERPVRTDGLPFVVTVGEERIYAGAFWMPLSSLSFDGVVIMDPLGADEPRIAISLGYPGPDFFQGEDPRTDERILAALQSAGKLE